LFLSAEVDVLHPATEAFAQALATLGGRDPHDLSDAALVADTEAVLNLKRQFDGFLARQLQVVDARDATTAECGRSTRAWLVEEQLLSQTDAAGRLQVARSYVTRPAIVEAMPSGALHGSLIDGAWSA
jgi:hypothetical protein